MQARGVPYRRVTEGVSGGWVFVPFLWVTLVRWPIRSDFFPWEEVQTERLIESLKPGKFDMAGSPPRGGGA